MKYPQNRQTVLINQLDKIMTGNGISNSELSQVSGVARPTIIRIRHDATQDWQSGTMLKIANALDVPVKSLFREQLVFDPKDVRNGFSPENLNQLDRCLSAHGLQLRYQPYSWQCKMNVRSKYRTNWRVSFVGNWQFHDGIHSELVLINCDAQRNRKTATSLDVDNLFSAIIASAIDYAKCLKIKRVVYPLPYKKPLAQQDEDTQLLISLMVKHDFTQELYFEMPALIWHATTTRTCVTIK